MVTVHRKDDSSTITWAELRKYGIEKYKRG
jgi:hypothetical protein